MPSSHGSMKQKLLLISLLLILPFVLASKAYAADNSMGQNVQMSIQAGQLDNRAIILHDYFAKYNSPLQDQAQNFIDAADKYNVDWKLVPAIAGAESTFGKQIPGGFNGWGWGVYGDQALYFKSWKDGIYTVTQGIREKYLNKGLTTPFEMNHVYAASPYWGGHVAYFVNDIQTFAKAYPTEQIASLANPTSNLKMAGTSAQVTSLALNQ